MNSHSKDSHKPQASNIHLHAARKKQHYLADCQWKRKLLESNADWQALVIAKRHETHLKWIQNCEYWKQKFHHENTCSTAYLQ